MIIFKPYLVTDFLLFDGQFLGIKVIIIY